jgi:hypothetical protein
MKMHTVKSSHISAVGHDPETNTLKITFGAGRSYIYKDVSAEDAAALVGAESPGRHLRQMGILDSGMRMDNED